MKIGLDINNKSLAGAIVKELKRKNFSIVEFMNEETNEKVDLFFSLNISNRDAKRDDTEIEVYYDSLSTIGLVTQEIVDLCLMANIKSITYKDGRVQKNIDENIDKSLIIRLSKSFEGKINDLTIDKILDIINNLTSKWKII